MPSRYTNRQVRRILRMQRRFAILGADLARDLNWYLRGGRKFFSRFSSEIINSHQWCFIVGCNNSGTSLLQGMLERTGQISTFQFEGQYYTRVLGRANRRGYERVWTEYADELSKSPADGIQCLPRLAHDWFEALPDTVQDIVVEKTPSNALRMEWLENAFPRSCFIGLIRNGYAVCEGIRRKGGKDVSRAARHWNKANKTMLENSKFVNRFLEVRYEDLVDNPFETMRTLLDFIGIDLQSLQLGATGGTRSDHRELRNFNADSISKLSAIDIELIEKNAEQMLTKFGYSPNL